VNHPKPDWKRGCVKPTDSIIDVLRVLDETALQIALVVDDQQKLLGAVTDGDIRRGILKNISVTDPVEAIMQRSITTGHPRQDNDSLISIMLGKAIKHIPIVDDSGQLVDLKRLDDLIRPEKRDNIVVIMAGGLGKRLGSLTEEAPKPLLKVGDRPILETIVSSLIRHGFHKFYFAVNYRGEMIKDYFKDGSGWGVSIRYLEEEFPMGTVGALSLLKERSNLPMIVMNGDLLTKINFQQLLDFHEETKSAATMCAREFDFQVPYGVVHFDGHQLLQIEEKPVQKYFVNAGIYALNSSALDLIPPKERFDMPQLLKKMMDIGQPTSVFPVREYWLDIGRVSDLEKAKGEFNVIFK